MHNVAPIGYGYAGRAFHACLIRLEPARTSWTAYYCNIAQALDREAKLSDRSEQMVRLIAGYDAGMASAESGEVVWLS